MREKRPVQSATQSVDCGEELRRRRVSSYVLMSVVLLLLVLRTFRLDNVTLQADERQLSIRTVCRHHFVADLLILAWAEVRGQRRLPVADLLIKAAHLRESTVSISRSL